MLILNHINMASNSITCPVCGSVMNSYVELCPKCAYEIHLLPDNAPKAIEEMEEHRAQLAKDAYLRLHETEDRLAKENAQLSKNLSAKQSEIETLTQKLAEQNSQPSAKEPVAYLVVKNGEKIVDMYSLDEGENTFGYLPSEGVHHQVLYGDFKDKHFSIRVTVSVNERGRKRAAFTIIPLEGQVCMAPNGANLISEGTPIEKNAVVYVGNVSFTLVSNKNCK